MGFAKWMAVLGASVSALGGCGDSPDGRRRAAEDALALWLEKGPTSYAYVIQTDCFCPNLEPRRVVVEGDVVRSPLDTDSDGRAPESTMTELLQRVVDRAGRDNATFEAEYDAELGYLKYEDVDGSSRVADDEFTIKVTCLAEGTSDDVCPLAEQ
jgi:Family of unknown function (DUF6174)